MRTGIPAHEAASNLVQALHPRCTRRGRLPDGRRPRCSLRKGHNGRHRITVAVVIETQPGGWKIGPEELAWPKT